MDIGRQPARAGATRRLAWARLCRLLGVTRIARVTGLDRTGIEVACAVRPGGHVLQVTNGKGLTFRQAAAGALLEAAELTCAERVDAADLHWATARELRARRVAHVSPAELGGAADAGNVAWRAARDLASGQPVLVPAAALHVPPQGGPVLGPTRLRWTSNGMGAHPSWPAALLHALLEAVERDHLARALPEGWTEAEIAARSLAAGALQRAAPQVARLAERIEDRGFEVHLFDLRPDAARSGPSRRGRAGILPVAGALLFDRAPGPIPLTAGYACRLDLESALRGALLEAAQSRLTDIHGAREDVAAAEPEGVERLRAACGAARRGPSPRPPDTPEPRRRPMPRRRAGPGEGECALRADPDRAVQRVLAGLRAAGFPRALALDLAPRDLGVHVAKVLVPGLLLSELL